MSDEPAPEETPEQAEQRIREAEQRRHRYRTTGSEGGEAAALGWYCSCGADSSEEDPFESIKERDKDVGAHVERACRRALRRGDG